MSPVISNRKRLLFLHVILFVFMLPFFSGLLFLLLSAAGITPAWKEAGVYTGKTAIEIMPLIHKQLLLSFLRANVIALITLLLVFFFGYLLCAHLTRKVTQTWMYFLSIPHVSLAAGFAFLIMPSGMLFRALAFISGREEVANIVTAGDSLGISMSIVVILKLVSFLIFMMLAVFRDYQLQYQILQSKLLGHNSFRTWLFIVFPQLLPKIFVPFLISLAYAIAPVDISLILGPQFPSSTGVLIQELLRQASLNKYIEAHVLCCALGLVTALSFALWFGIFKAIRYFLCCGYSVPQAIQVSDKKARTISIAGFAVFAGLIVFSSLLLLFWCCIIRWDFPSLFPSKLGVSALLPYLDRFLHSLGITLLLAALSSVLSLCLAILLLELLGKCKWQFQSVVLGLLMLPILIPSLVYITGVHVFFLLMRINGSLAAMIWAHSLRITPYMVLLLYGTFKTYNPYFIQQARVLGKRYYSSLFRIKLPMLLTPIFYALLVGMLVSIAEYVSSQFIGEGRWETSTLLVVAMNSGGNRQIISASGTLLSVVNLLILSFGLLCGYFQKGIRKVKL